MSAAAPTMESEKPNRSVSVPSILNGLQQKNLIIHQVIEGRLPLLEAATKFQAIHRVAVAPLEHVTTGMALSVDSENICRTVIGWVHLTLRDRPEQAELITDRLERELQNHIDRFGKVNLALTR